MEKFFKNFWKSVIEKSFDRLADNADVIFFVIMPKFVLIIIAAKLIIWITGHGDQKTWSKEGKKKTS